MIWFRSANSHTGPQLHRCIRGRTDGSIRLRANLLQKPLASGGASTDEYTLKCSQLFELSRSGEQPGDEVPADPPYGGNPRDRGNPGHANKYDRYNEIASSTTITFRERSPMGLIKHFVPASEQGHSRSRERPTIDW